MKKQLALAAFLVAAPTLSFAGMIPVCFDGGGCFSADDVEKGAHCQVKGVTLLAKSDADCTKAGGKVLQVKDATEKK